MDLNTLDEKVVKEWVGNKTREEVISILVGAKVPVAPVLTVDETAKNPQVLARDMLVEMNHPQAGRIKVLGSPIKLSETPVKIETPAPLLGQHNEELLSTLLGYSKEEIAKLRKDGVIT